MPALEARDIYSPGACIEGWAWVKAYVGRGGVRRGVVWSNRLGKIDKESTTVSAQLGHQLSSGDTTYTYASACHFCQLVCKFLHVDVVPCVNLTWFSSRCVELCKLLRSLTFEFSLVIVYLTFQEVVVEGENLFVEIILKEKLWIDTTSKWLNV